MKKIHPDITKEEVKRILLENELKEKIFMATGVKQFVNLVYSLDKKQLKILIKKLERIKDYPNKKFN